MNFKELIRTQKSKRALKSRLSHFRAISLYKRSLERSLNSLEEHPVWSKSLKSLADCDSQSPEAHMSFPNFFQGSYPTCTP